MVLRHRTEKRVALIRSKMSNEKASTADVNNFAGALELRKGKYEKNGYSAVAGTLASYCEQYSIANLEEKEIRYLSLKWHQAILGESDKTEADSNNVCDIILNDPRITALAENPLMLTTLLFVKRWVGYLPTKKYRLYEEMIKLLLVTWNAVAHDKLDMDETEPQLAFVAYYMTTQGQQKITRDKLEKYF